MYGRQFDIMFLFFLLSTVCHITAKNGCNEWLYYTIIYITHNFLSFNSTLIHFAADYMI